MEISHAAIILITRTLGFLAAAAAVQLRQLVHTYVSKAGATIYSPTRMHNLLSSLEQTTTT